MIIYIKLDSIYSHNSKKHYFHKKTNASLDSLKTTLFSLFRRKHRRIQRWVNKVIILPCLFLIHWKFMLVLGDSENLVQVGDGWNKKGSIGGWHKGFHWCVNGREYILHTYEHVMDLYRLMFWYIHVLLHCLYTLLFICFFILVNISYHFIWTVIHTFLFLYDYFVY